MNLFGYSPISYFNRRFLEPIQGVNSPSPLEMNRPASILLRRVGFRYKNMKSSLESPHLSGPVQSGARADREARS